MRSFQTLILGLMLIVSARAANAQFVKVDTLTNWKRTFRAGLNINQSAFSSNWKAGGISSFGFNALLNYRLNYRKNKTSWDNEFDLLFGMVNNAGQGYRKTLDRIFVDTKLGYQLGKDWDFFYAMNAQTQFAKGYKYVKDANGIEQPFLISDILSPMFVTATLGFEYHPVTFFKVRFSPLAPRLTYLANNDGRYYTVDPLKPYGVNVNENTRYEWYAAQILAEFGKDIAKNINLKWRYVLFANYQNMEWKQVDHRVDLSITAKVNKFFNVNLGGIFLYDYDQDSAPQYSQAFSLGFLYTFQNWEEKK